MQLYVMVVMNWWYGTALEKNISTPFIDRSSKDTLQPGTK